MFTSHKVGESLGCSVRFLGRRMRRKARMGRRQDLDGCSTGFGGIEGVSDHSSSAPNKPHPESHAFPCWRPDTFPAEQD